MSKPNVHGLPQHLRKDDKGYFLDYLILEGELRKHKRVRLGEIPAAQAKRILAQHTQEIVAGEFLPSGKPQVTFDEAADSFLAFSESRKKSYRRDFFSVKALKVFFGGRPLASLTPSMVEDFLKERRKKAEENGKNLKGSSLNREITGLKWDLVDLKAGSITLKSEDTKTQEQREIPLDEGFKDLFRKIPKVLSSPYVFNFRGHGLKNPKTAFLRACQRAKITDFRFHDLRHCAVTNFRKAGVSDTTIMSISGHKTYAVFRRYDRIDRENRLDALAKVRRFKDSRHELDSYRTQGSISLISEIGG